MRAVAMCWLMLTISTTARSELVGLDAADLREIDGQNGVALAIDYGLNIDTATNTPLCGASNTLNCRIAVQLNNRDNETSASFYSDGSGKGEWLVFKNVYGRITVPRLTLDAAEASYTDDASGVSSVPALRLSTQSSDGVPTSIILNNINIQAIAVEIDSVAAPTSAADYGYETANESGFLSLRIHDLAGATMRGTMTVFACQGNHPSC